MRIGLDFDNTIVSYDTVFHQVAQERGLIPLDLPVSKTSVRDHLRRAGREDTWTEMQGWVYGTRMNDAEPFPGVRETLRHLRGNGHELFIVSHKTRHPYRGPAYDLHQAAVAWIDTVLRDAEGALVTPSCIYFCERKEEKIARIAEVGCEAFLDDLPEILVMRNFPVSARRLLFDPAHQYPAHWATEGCVLHRVVSWLELPPLLADVAGWTETTPS